jgi:hypothetical protein
MPAVDIQGDDRAPVPRRRTSWLAWVAAALLLLLALGYFVVKPQAERIVKGALEIANTLLTSILQGLSALVVRLFNDACRRVEQSDEVKALLGDPIQCAPIEQTEWIDAQGRQEFEFKFKITGPKGTGQAHVVATATEKEFKITRIEVTGPGGETVTLPTSP